MQNILLIVAVLPALTKLHPEPDPDENSKKFWEISGKKSIDNIQNEIDELNKNFQDESKLAKEKAEKNANKDSTRGASSGSQKFDPVKDVEKIQQQLKNKASNKVAEFFPNPELKIKRSTLGGSIDKDAVNEAVSKAKELTKKQEEELEKKETAKDDKDPSTVLANFLSARKGIVAQVKEAGFNTVNTAKTLKRNAKPGEKLASRTGLRDVNVDGTKFIENCLPEPKCDPSSKYRTINGECNNLNFPKFGMAKCTFLRVKINNYWDGNWIPRGVNNDLPEPRLISQNIIRNKPAATNDFTYSLMSFGQFIAHDVTFTAVFSKPNGGSIRCCEERKKGSKFIPGDVCNNLFAPGNDSFFKPDLCFGFARSLIGPRVDCKPGGAEQVNTNTHWLDLSAMYGNDNEELTKKELRGSKDGLMFMGKGNNGVENVPFRNGRICTDKADIRVNVQPGHIAFTFIFLREHNRIAKELKKLNPSWNDEKLFQEARRINIAKYQHIVFKEFLPALLGETTVAKYGLLPLKQGHKTDTYLDRNIDPRVTNEFAAAAFRLGHSMISADYELWDTKGETMVKKLELFKNFLRNDMCSTKDMIAQVTKGMCMQEGRQTDKNFPKDVLNHLFGSKSNNFLGIDLVSFNIHRGRDHGLQGYVKYRKVCEKVLKLEGKPVNSFDDLDYVFEKEDIEKLKKLYKRPKDIDFYVGLILEKSDGPLHGTDKAASKSKTFACYVADQFLRLQFGDRFYYEYDKQTGSFTPDQLTQIKKTSLARIICDNTKVEEVQPQIFWSRKLPGNEIKSCNDPAIERVDLSVFKE